MPARHSGSGRSCAGQAGCRFGSTALAIAGAHRYPLFCRSQSGLFPFFRSAFVWATEPRRERWIRLRQLLPAALRLHPHLQLCRSCATRSAHCAQLLVRPLLPPLSRVYLQPAAFGGHADAGGAGAHAVRLWPGSDSHPAAAAGMAPSSDQLLEHARLDHVHGGVLLSPVSVVDHPPPSAPDAAPSC